MIPKICSFERDILDNTKCLSLLKKVIKPQPTKQRGMIELELHQWEESEAKNRTPNRLSINHKYNKIREKKIDKATIEKTHSN